MGILTPFFNLFKPAKTDPAAVQRFNENMDIIDEQMHRPPLTVNFNTPDADRNIYLKEVPLATNLSSEQAQMVTGTFVQRASGGGAPIDDGNALLLSLKGNMIHTGYVPEELNMDVTPVERTAPPAITAEINIETFEAYVETAGTYTLTYTTGWSATPADYGITITNTPVNGDKITIVWDGTNDPEMTVSAVPRPVPAAITATLDRDTFVSVVTGSTTITLTYTTAWSANPATYGVTVTNTPVSGDTITIVYVKEDRGTITPATPTTFNATGWNLYDNSTGQARVVKYSDVYGYRIGGTYTLLEFAATVSGTRTTISPVNGLFSVPADGYLFVTGGNATTYIYATWSDWTDSYSGNFQTYSVDTVDLTEVMLLFPDGLLSVGNVRDEINMNAQTAINRVQRIAYTSENIAAVIASGVDYDADTNYIYAVLTTPVTTVISVDPSYIVNDHGIEFFTGTSVPVVTEVLYGENLKDKLRTDVLTISEQALTDSQKARVQQNIGLVPTQQRNISSPGYVADARVINAINGQIASKDWTPASGGTILDFVNSLDKAYLPVSFVKRGTVTPPDSPVGSDEFTGVVCGNGDRIRVTIKPYKSASNNQEYSRDIYQSAWLEGGWDTLNTWRPYITKEYTVTATRTVAAGGLISIAAQDFKDGDNNPMAIPTGYFPVGIAYSYPGSSNTPLVSFNAFATGGEIAIIYKAISSMTNVSMTSKLTVVYAHT